MSKKTVAELFADKAAKKEAALGRALGLVEFDVVLARSSNGLELRL